MDDDSSLMKEKEFDDIPLRDILDRVKFEDENRDHSYQSLTADEKTEIALFHSFKQDPYFKHYLFNHLR